MNTWATCDREIAGIAAQMLGAADYFDAHPDWATDEQVAQTWRAYVAKMRDVAKPA